MKSKNNPPLSSYERAKKRVDRIKGFYGHLSVYIIVNLILLFIRSNYDFYFGQEGIPSDTIVLSDINWETYGTPIVWGVGLTIHAISVFGKNPFLGKQWEARQIEKYMKED